MVSTIPDTADWAIIGAGGSGLWLALEMHFSGLLEHHTLTIWEKETHKANDRTWCFWAKKTDPFLDQIISKKWSHHQFEGDRVSLAPYQYHHIRSEDFYAACKNILHSQPNVYWIQDEVLSVEQKMQSACVIGKKHKMSVQHVFNSAHRPFGKGDSLPKIQLWQSFLGYQVEWSNDVLNPDCMKLMDFEVKQQGHTQFMYLLPFGKRRALVELTRFGTEILSKKQAHQVLHEYCSEIGTDFQILEVEQAKIPMTNAFNNKVSCHTPNSRIIPIGTMGGAIKPSTGYGFLNMRAHAKEIVRALKQNISLPKVRRAYRFRLYDKLLLNILTEHPNEGRPIFRRLFRHQPIQRILKFLDEKTNMIEEAQIFTPLPAGIFLNQLFKEWRLR